MAVAATNPNADPILTEAIDGPAQATNFSAPSFSLIDQDGQPVTSASLRGKAVAVTFLDPVCTSDCPVIAAEFKQAAQRLSADRARVAFVAIDANPRYLNADYLAAFDPPGEPPRGQQLAVPNRHPGPAQSGVEGVRYRSRLRPRRGHDRSQRGRLRHRPGRPGSRHLEHRSRTGHLRHRRLVLPNIGPGGQQSHQPIVTGPEGIRRRWARRWFTAAVLAVMAAGGCSAGGNATDSAATAAAATLPTPLATSLGGPAGTWASVAMGQLDEPLNTFWQLLYRPAGGTRWSNQVEATVVATNGGIVLAPLGGELWWRGCCLLTGSLSPP